MAEKIGYQTGIKAFFDWYRKQPGVPPRGPNYDPNDINTWPWPDKMERTLKILANDHDAAIVTPTPPPDPDPEPEPVPAKYAPQTHNPGTGGQDARYCIQGLPINNTGRFYEPHDPGCMYDTSGLSLGARTKRQIAGLKGAESMDGREPCQGYTKDGVTYGPGITNWPAESYLK